MPEMTYRDALKSALVSEMDRDARVLLMGEDIGVYGGTFLVTQGLLERYGEARVIDTPIAELGFIGAAIGMAMLGLRPVVEVMTWNFALVAADQIINNAAKIRYFSGGQAAVPMVIRGPNGSGVQLSAQHSQSFAALYGRFPGLKVVAPATPADAKGMLVTAIRDGNPVIFLEHAALYGLKGEVPDGEHAVPFGKARIAREGRDVTLVAYSRLVHTSLAAAERLAQEGIEAEVIDVRCIRPLDADTLIASARKTHRAVVMQAQWPRYGTAAEFAATIAEGAFDDLDAPVERVTGADVPAPYARNLELRSIAGVDEIVAAARRALYRH